MTGGAELLILVVVIVLVFGAGWLPKAARNLGKAKVEFDEVQRQFHETKDSVVEATGVKELESTVRKANKALNTSPQKLMKDAAKSAVTGSAATRAAADSTAPEADAADPSPSDPAQPDSHTAKVEPDGEERAGPSYPNAGEPDGGIEDAEIVDP